MSAKSYNRTIRTHKLTLEALWLLLWPQLIKWAKYQGFDDANIKRISCDLAQSRPSEVIQTLEDQLENAHLLQLLQQYNETLPPTSLYWRNYMSMVLILLKCVRAELTGNWQMHKSTFLAMLPWFAHYDHTNYMRWGIVYATDVNQCPIQMYINSFQMETLW